MGVLESLPHWLERSDVLAKADAILALSCGPDLRRLKAGLDLLRRGYAPRLLASMSTFDGWTQSEVEVLAARYPHNVGLILNSAVSTRDEAVETRQILKRLHCKSLLVVTSNYHTRRTKNIFTREFLRDGIKVRVISVPEPGLDAKSWWKSREGRTELLFESMKLLLNWLRLDPPVPAELRYRLKCWVIRTMP